MALVAGSGNVAYRLAYNLLREAYDKVYVMVTQIMAPEFGDQASFEAIANAVAAGDTAGAQQRAKELLRKGSEPIYAVLDQLALIRLPT